jgi:hypothetical protein
VVGQISPTEPGKRRLKVAAKSSRKVVTRKCVLSYPEHIADPQGLLTFVHSHGFEDDWRDIGLKDEDIWIVQLMIQSDPEKNPVVKGTGGLRKMRFAPPTSSGRRKWFRVGYVYFPEAATVLLIVAYAKNEADDLSAADKKFIREMIEREHKIFSTRAVK